MLKMSIYQFGYSFLLWRWYCMFSVIKLLCNYIAQVLLCETLYHSRFICNQVFRFLDFSFMRKVRIILVSTNVRQVDLSLSQGLINLIFFLFRKRHWFIIALNLRGASSLIFELRFQKLYGLLLFLVLSFGDKKVHAFGMKLLLAI